MKSVSNAENILRLKNLDVWHEKSFYHHKSPRRQSHFGFKGEVNDGDGLKETKRRFIDQFI